MNNPHDATYLNALRTILETGEERSDRTGVGTISVFGLQMRFDLSQGFPAVTTKKLAWRAVVSELLWFIEGSGDERRLAEILHGTRDPAKKTIWTANAEAEYWQHKAKFKGDLGRIYGSMWRKWPTGRHTFTLGAGDQTHIEETVDQLTNLIESIKRDPTGRRHILTAWNPAEIDNMALPPCHLMSQFYVSNSRLSCQMYQRSMDGFLGCPFNIASYALLTHMIAQVCNLGVGDLIISVGDAHIYKNSIDAVKEQITREPFPMPSLKLNPDIKSITEFKMHDIDLVGYQSHEALKVPMAV